MSRGRYWCFTLNNPLATEIQGAARLVRDDQRVTYVCWGVERGESGTPHLQGYLELSAKLRLGGVRKLSGLGRAHFELRKGTQEQAIEYCRKEGRFFDFGERMVSKQGQRNDLQAIQEKLDEGASDEDIAANHFGQWVRYRKSFTAYRELKRPKTLRDVSVYFIWGAAGTGKTRFVFEREPSLWISSDPTLQWFDGYSGEEAVLLDDYRGEATTSFILRVLDRYPLKVPVKGSFTQWLPLRIYITSNMDPKDFHTDASEAFRRRIKKIVHFSGPLDFDSDTGKARIEGLLE